MRDRPVFVNSIPKSGTYLLAAILEELDLAFTHWHVFETFYDDYTGVPLDVARATPQRFRVRHSVTRTMSRLRPGHFAVGHLRYNKRTVRALRGCNVIFLKRDLRQCLVSHMRWQAATGRDQRPWTRVTDPQKRMLAYLSTWGRSFINRASAIVEWDTHAGHVLTFEDLCVPSARDRIARRMGLASSSLRAVNGSRDTLTRMPAADRTCFWSDDAESLFRLLRGHELNTTLGFEVPTVEHP